MGYDIVLVDSSDWPVPEFNDRGHPDLLRWDDAVDAWEPEETVIATVYDEDDAKQILALLKPKYDSKETAEELEIQKHQQEEEESYTLQDWWSDYDQHFCDLDHYGLTEKDDEGKPYNWDDRDILYQQKPSYHDFISLLAHQAAGDVFNGIDCVDEAMTEKRRYNQQKMNNLWKLHDKLYESDLEFGDCFVGGIDTGFVYADISIKVHGAKRKEADNG